MRTCAGEPVGGPVAEVHRHGARQPRPPRHEPQQPAAPHPHTPARRTAAISHQPPAPPPPRRGRSQRRILSGCWTWSAGLAAVPAGLPLAAAARVRRACRAAPAAMRTGSSPAVMRWTTPVAPSARSAPANHTRWPAPCLTARNHACQAPHSPALHGQGQPRPTPKHKHKHRGRSLHHCQSHDPYARPMGGTGAGGTEPRQAQEV